MSLSLLQSYSSDEDEHHQPYISNSDEDHDGDGEPSTAAHPSLADRSIFDHLPPQSSSALPSAFDAFSEVSGPPQFLNNSMEEYNPVREEAEQEQERRGSRRQRKVKKDLPSGAVLEAKPQLVGIHERVRSDINGSQPPTSTTLSTSEETKRVPSVTNPTPEDAADLLRMCLQCGIPKTFSNARGMVCPVCGDRPPKDPSTETKNKGSTIKDKEKSKRMKGQSSHASWKSETEMHLRQQFD
uniref:Uncharacterized protein n=1 Tax=Lotus japonicus TaxID=34305 RepID=I3SMR3_LOTJA|nr:unknown [Lotus japonicus]